MISKHNVEPKEFVENMRCYLLGTKYKESQVSTYCRLCLEVKAMECKLKLKYLAHHIDYDQKTGILDVEHTRKSVIKFLRSIKKPGQIQEFILDAFRIAEEDISKHYNDFN